MNYNQKTLAQVANIERPCSLRTMLCLTAVTALSLAALPASAQTNDNVYDPSDLGNVTNTGDMGRDAVTTRAQTGANTNVNQTIRTDDYVSGTVDAQYDNEVQAGYDNNIDTDTEMNSGVTVNSDTTTNGGLSAQGSSESNMRMNNNSNTDTGASAGTRTDMGVNTGVGVNSGVGINTGADTGIGIDTGTGIGTGLEGDAGVSGGVRGNNSFNGTATGGDVTSDAGVVINSDYAELAYQGLEERAARSTSNFYSSTIN